MRGVPRYREYALGAELRDTARRVLLLVVRADSRRSRLVRRRAPRPHRPPPAGLHLEAAFERRYWRCIRSAGEGCLVFYPVGCFVELRGPQRQIAEPALGLRSARRPRGGWRYASGLPRRASLRWRARALAAGLAVAEVGTRSRLPERVLASAARPH